MGKKWEAKRKEEKGINYQLCVCVAVAAVQQVIELCTFFLNTLGDDNKKKKK
jgi:hypothetical protein